ncbi:MAG: tetratricopeptide repeat protein [Streptomyces sp.]|nr:tetratricopeptide repeat protein [Streptomyces sp.]
MALANIAWIMASHGKKVLVIDWDLENPGLHLYYAKYLTDPDLSTGDGILDMFSAFAAAGQQPLTDNLRALHPEHAAFDTYDVDVRYAFPNGGELYYLSPGHLDGDIGAARHKAFDWSQFQHTPDGREFLAALRHRMTGSKYDYILIDSLTGFAEDATVCTLALPDTVVLGINLDRQSVAGARDMARRVYTHSRPIRLHVLPLRVDSTTDPNRVEAAVTTARAALDEFLGIDDEDDLERYWQEVRLPHQAQLALGEELAVMTQDPNLPYTLLHACVKAADRITDGEVDTFRRVPKEDREEYAVWRARREREVPQLTATVLNHPDDQLWADWVAEQLSAAGIQVKPDAVPCPDEPSGQVDATGPDTDYVIALLSKRLEGTVEGDRVARLTEDAPVEGASQPKKVGLRVSSAPLLTLFDWPDAVNLAGQTEESAHRALFSRFTREIGTPPFLPAEHTRFPGMLPKVTNLPMRNAHFVGRSDELAKLRRELTFAPDEHAAPRVLWGVMRGAGKFQVALEYAHRFASQYDLVWHVPATTEDGIKAALRELAARLNALLRGARDGDDPDALLHDLRTGTYCPRWLLVFDGAENSEAVERFLPTTGPGHILITSRTPDWPPGYEVQRIGPFTPEESLSLLEQRLCEADPAALGRLAERFGHLPQVLTSAISLVEAAPSQIDRFIARLDSLEGAAQAEIMPEYGTMGTLYRGIYADLSRNHPAAARLLELCSFLSPDGVGMMVVESEGMTKLLARLDESLQDELRMRSVVNRLARATLAVVDQSSERLLVNRVMQDLVRGWMDAEKRTETQREVLAVLASMVPSDLKRHQPRFRPVFAELDRHLEASGALESTDQGVHRWLVSQAYHRRVTERWDEARELGEQALERWRQAPGQVTQEVLRMESEVASSSRETGQYAYALSLSKHAFETLNERKPKDVYTLLAARGYAGDLRATGEFRKAFERDQATHRGLIEAIGKEHSATLDASNNLALSKFYIETVKAAADLHRETHEIRLQQFGADDFRPWLSFANLGTYFRELGDLESSERYLLRACERFRTLTGQDSHHHLGALASLGMTMVRKGETKNGRARLQDALRGFRGQWGDRYPRTMACELSLAIGLNAAGSPSDALRRTQEVYERYQSVFGEKHPFTSICLNNMAVYHLASGDPEAARSCLQKAVYQLETVFGRDHRYPLAARLNQSNCMRVLGRDTSNEDVGIHEDCRQPTAWGERHPVTLKALANRLSSATDDGDGELRAILDRYVSELPERHPLRAVLLTDPYQRAGVDLEVQDV